MTPCAAPRMLCVALPVAGSPYCAVHAKDKNARPVASPQQPRAPYEPPPAVRWPEWVDPVPFGNQR